MNSNIPNKNQNLSRVKKVLEENPGGMTIRDISKEVDLNRNSVAKYLEILTISGEAERRKVGPAKVYSVSDKVPLSAVLNYSDDWIVVLDRSMELLQANSKFFEGFGLEKEEVVGEPVEDIDIPPFRKESSEDESFPSFPDESVLPEVQSALSEDEERTVEVSFDQESDKYHIEVDMIPTTFQNGMTGITLVFKDITERKEAEKECRRYRERLEELVKERSSEIRRAKQRLSSLINASHDSIYMVDRDCRYILVNDEIVSRIGVTEEKLVGKKFGKFHTKKDTEEFRERVERVFETGEMVTHKHIHGDSDRRFVRTMSPVRDPDTDDIESVAVVSKEMTSFCDCPICGFK